MELYCIYDFFVSFAVLVFYVGINIWQMKYHEFCHVKAAIKVGYLPKDIGIALHTIKGKERKFTHKEKKINMCYSSNVKFTKAHMVVRDNFRSCSAENIIRIAKAGWMFSTTTMFITAVILTLITAVIIPKLISESSIPIEPITGGLISAAKIFIILMIVLSVDSFSQKDFKIIRKNGRNREFDSWNDFFDP